MGSQFSGCTETAPPRSWVTGPMAGSINSDKCLLYGCPFRFICFVASVSYSGRRPRGSDGANGMFRHVESTDFGEKSLHI